MTFWPSSPPRKPYEAYAYRHWSAFEYRTECELANAFQRPVRSNLLDRPTYPWLHLSPSPPPPPAPLPRHLRPLPRSNKLGRWRYA